MIAGSSSEDSNELSKETDGAVHDGGVEDNEPRKKIDGAVDDDITLLGGDVTVDDDDDTEISK